MEHSCKGWPDSASEELARSRASGSISPSLLYIIIERHSELIVLIEVLLFFLLLHLLAVLRPPRLLGLLEHGLLGVLLGPEGLLREGLRLLQGVRHQEVVEDRARLHLPQLKAHVCAALAPVVQLVVLHIVRVGDHGVLPGALVVGVLYPLGLPLALVLRVVNHGGLPLAVLLLVPVVRLLRVRVGDLGRDVVVPLWLCVLRVVHHFVVYPILRFGDVWIFDLLWLQEVPIIFQVTTLHTRIINEDLESIILFHMKSVQV
mmetsp:Transcript_22755/g.35975  ORF Transcript_22755/g.35975 Transcript_22755/m.35975 type:complete len:260 (-) Transcript_22755:31-810(-)